MNEQIISLETAKLAKERGFTPNQKEVFYSKMTGRTKYEDIPTTQSLLQKWLRETHKIDTGLYYWDNNEYSYRIQKIVKGKMKHFNKDIWVGTYEETLEVSLMESLKLITIEKVKSITQEIIDNTKSW